MFQNKLQKIFIEATDNNDLLWNRMLHLAKKRNIQVYKTKLNRLLKGCFFHDSSYGVTAILLDSTLGEKQNFVMAHELGHAVLHKVQGSLIMGYGLSDKGNVTRAECEANRFARKLINLLSRR